MVRYHGYFVLAVVVPGAAGLAGIMAVFPGETVLRPFVPLLALWAGGLIASWVGLALYFMVRSRLRREGD